MKQENLKISTFIIWVLTFIISIIGDFLCRFYNTDLTGIILEVIIMCLSAIMISECFDDIIKSKNSTLVE